MQNITNTVIIKKEGCLIWKEGMCTVERYYIVIVAWGWASFVSHPAVSSRNTTYIVIVFVYNYILVCACYPPEEYDFVTTAVAVVPLYDGKLMI